MDIAKNSGVHLIYPKLVLNSAISGHQLVYRFVGVMKLYLS